MPTPTSWTTRDRSYQGTNQLHLSWLEDESKRIQDSPSTATITTDPNQSRLQVHATWEYEGEKQSGAFLIVQEEGKDTLSAAWTDSWHQNNSLLILTGTNQEGTLDLLGSYSVEGHEPWGWRIKLTPNGDQNWTLEMFNVTPDGEEIWAVRAIYS